MNCLTDTFAETLYLMNFCPMIFENSAVKSTRCNSLLTFVAEVRQQLRPLECDATR